VKKVRILAGLCLLLLVGGVIGYVYLQQQLGVPHTSASVGQVFEVPPGLRAREVVKLLHDKDVIADENLALVYLAVSGNRKALKAGEYLFDKPMTIPEVIDRLSRGGVYLHRFTVPEGLTVAEIAKLWETQGFGKAEEFASAAASSGSLVEDLEGNEKASLEGYLFPETYSFPQRTTPRKAIEAMVARFRVVLDQTKKEIPVESWPLSVRETLILASLVEEEARHHDERPLIASVFMNRINNKGLLQCDPTVVYALERANRYRGHLLSVDLQFDSPYNTYRYAGLPPGPISNPGRRSLQAAAKPATSAYYYFVRTIDGRHTFSETLADHNRAVAAYRAMVRNNRK
jgi:UPF0755 protein